MSSKFLERIKVKSARGHGTGQQRFAHSRQEDRFVALKKQEKIQPLAGNKTPRQTAAA